MRAIRWGIAELGPSIAYYLAGGVLVAAAIMASIPPGWIDGYLGNGGVFGLLVVAVFGAAIYVCAVAHIPVVATLLASGAAPGAAIVFLVTGAATNLPELVALYNAIGRRTVVVCVLGLVVASLLAGIAVNAILLPGFEPAFDPLRSLEMLRTGQLLQPSVAGWFAAASAIVLGGLAVWGLAARIRARSKPVVQTGNPTETSCPAACCCPSETQVPAASSTTGLQRRTAG